MNSIALPGYRPAVIGGEAVPAIDSRELHAVLEVKTPHRDWIKRRVADAHLVDHFDFEVSLNSARNPKGGRPDVVYLLTRDACKHIAMMEGTEIGHLVRLAFIEAEKRDRANRTARALPSVNGVEIGPHLENHARQRGMSVAFANRVGNKDRVIGNRILFALALTGRRPKEIRETAREMGLSCRQSRSAPEVWRTVGTAEAPVYAALNAMTFCGVAPEDSLRFVGRLTDACNAQRQCFLDAGVSPDAFGRLTTMPADEFNRMLTEQIERRRALVDTMALFPEGD